MRWFSAAGSWEGRLLFERALAAIYLIAFVVARNQFRALLGSRGILPIPEFVARVRFGRAPSIFHRRYSDACFEGVTIVGAIASVALLAGVVDRAPLWTSMVVWALVWALYLSIVNVGQVWYGFGWETLLLEAGFLAIFLGPTRVAPPVVVLWLIRWLLFRVEFGAGLIKMRGDRCWRDLTCLRYHHETQPMPNAFSWYFHHLPDALHKVEVIANHGAQLVVPWLLFTPQPLAGFAALAIVVTQSWLVLSGNFSWLNVITITLALSAIGDGLLHHAVPLSPPHLASPPGWFEIVVLAMLVLIAVKSWQPARNLVSRRQLMNASFDPWHLVNTYGAFGSITRVRHEIVIEGTRDREVTPATTWLEYEFKGKPGDPMRRPRQIAPYHLRLDWLMWFAALSPRVPPWFVGLVAKLLAGDRDVSKLLRTDPFVDSPPTFVRARLYRYAFTSREERRRTRAWWRRTLVGEYLDPVSLPRDTRRA
jgi:hypothetical protein